jgi:DNA primase
MEFAQQVKSSVDIVHVIGEYVRLKKMGSGSRFIGLCPFHTEKTPSFNVNGTLGFYKCFGCNAGGDVIKFVMEIEHLTFWEALKDLAEKNGIAMPKRSDFSDEETRRRAKIYEMHEIAERTFRENLYGGAGGEARAYLERRGVTREVAQQFGLGLSDRGGQQLTRLFEKQGFGVDSMEESGLVLKRQDGSGYFDRFRGRLMFPIHNESGKVIAFGGRALAKDDEPKYLNSSKTALYEKERVLYNLHRAKEPIRKSGRTIIVEGYMDVIGVSAAGFGEVVAPCGTALTNYQVRSMKRFADHVIVNFDPDTAGANATERSIEMLLREQVRVKILQLPGELDPDEFIKDKGMEAYEAAIAGARSFFHWLADRTRARIDSKTPEDRRKVMEALLPYIQWMPDRIDRLAVAGDVAEYVGIERGMVLDEFKRAAAERREARPVRNNLPAFAPNEQLLLKALLTNPEAREELLPVLKELTVVQRFQTRGIFEALLRLAEAKPDFTFSDLHERLPEAERTLLATVILADEEGGDTVSYEQALESMRSLTAVEKKSQIGELRTRIREAEKAGNMEEALRLAEELDRRP